MKLPITERLAVVSEMVAKNKILCDIGCDHGYLPLKLLSDEKTDFVYACDVNDGPLLTARKNFDKFSLSDKADFIKGDGLKAVWDKSFDAVTICGMGGRLIAKILDDKRDILTENHQIILQPMKDAYFLREYLSENNFFIKKEALAREDRRYYNIIEVKSGKKQMLSLLNSHTGMEFIDKNSPLFYEYLKKQHEKFTKMLYLKNGHENTESLKKLIFELEKVLN